MGSMLSCVSSLSEMISQNDFELQKRSPVFSPVLKKQFFPKNRNTYVLRITRLKLWASRPESKKIDQAG